MSADSIATSVPLANAIPTSACAKRRSVIHTVAGHRDDLALGLQLLDLCRFVLRHDLGEDLIDAELFCDSLSGLPIVTGHHYDLDALPMQFGDRLFRRRFDGIGNADQTHGCPSTVTERRCQPIQLVEP